MVFLHLHYGLPTTVLYSLTKYRRLLLRVFKYFLQLFVLSGHFHVMNPELGSNVQHLLHYIH